MKARESVEPRTYALSGKRPEAEKILLEMKQRGGKEHAPPYKLALLYAGLGDNNLAFEWLELERARQEKATPMVNIKVEPQLDGLRADKRFADLLRRLRLST